MYKLYNSLGHSHHLDNKYLKYILITSILALSSLFLLTIFNFLVSRDYNDIDIIFSPYKYVKTNYNNTINSISTNASGSSMSLYKLMNDTNRFDTITIAFAIGDCNNDSWNMDNDIISNSIQNLIHNNLNYIISTGGANNKFTCNNDSIINFINKYNSKNLIGIDFDIESNQTQAEIDGIVYSIKYAKLVYPNLKFSFTVQSLGGTSNSNLGKYGVMVYNSINNISLSNYYINLMSFDYGAVDNYHCIIGSNNVCNMSASAIQSINDLHNKYYTPYNKIELTIKIGNGNNNEIFTFDDVDIISKYAKLINLHAIHFWSLDNDYMLKYTMRFIDKLLIKST